MIGPRAQRCPALLEVLVSIIHAGNPGLDTAAVVKELLDYILWMAEPARFIVVLLKGKGAPIVTPVKE